MHANDDVWPVWLILHGHITLAYCPTRFLSTLSVSSAKSQGGETRHSESKTADYSLHIFSVKIDKKTQSCNSFYQTL